MKLYIHIMAALCLIPMSSLLAIREENFNLGDDITDIGTLGLLGKKNDARKKEAWEKQREREEEVRRERRVGRSKYRDHRYDQKRQQKNNRDDNDRYYQENDSFEE